MEVSPSSFERDIVHRLLTEAARVWVISYFLATKRLPSDITFYAYPNGEVSFDWGNAPGPSGPLTPLRGKRVVINLKVENQ